MDKNIPNKIIFLNTYKVLRGWIHIIKPKRAVILRRVLTDEF